MYIYFYFYKDELLYIGSTENKKKREIRHRSSLKCGSPIPFYKNLREQDLTLEDLDKEVILTELTDRYLLYLLEGNLIRMYSPRYNSNIPGRTRTEWEEDNKENIALRQTEYYKTNKERLFAYQKKYQELNRELILGKKKNYREQNREKINEEQNKKRRLKKKQLLNKRNTSGFTGVSFHKAGKSWVSRFRKNGKCMFYQSGFKTAEEASIARNNFIDANPELCKYFIKN